MKIDFHCHSYHSKDGISSPEKLIKNALKRGLDGLALTDHDTAGGWKKAKETAEKLKAILVLGQEIKIKKGKKTVGEILGYFLKEEIRPKGKTIEEIIREIKKQGGIAIIAHPYHWRKPFKELEKYKNLVDGVEVYNSRSQSKKGNRKTLDFAQKNNLSMVAGSDAHSCFEVGNAYLEAEAESIDEFKEIILQKKILPVKEYEASDNFRVTELSNGVKIFGKQSPIFAQFSAGLGKLMNLFRQPK